MVGGRSTGGEARVYRCKGAPVAAVNDVQTITVDSCTNSTVTLSKLPGGRTYTAAQDVTPTALQTALNALVGANSYVVTGTYSAGSGGTYIITAGTAKAGKPLTLLGVSAVFVGGSTPGVAIVHTTPGVKATYGYNAPIGSLLVDGTNAQLYINTGTQQIPVWTPVLDEGSPIEENAPVTLTYTASGTTSIDPTLGSFFVATTATGNSNFSLASVPPAGQIITILIHNDAGGARTITFTTHFDPATTLVGTVSKAAVISFISDGTNAYEVSRSGAATATAGE